MELRIRMARQRHLVAVACIGFMGALPLVAARADGDKLVCDVQLTLGAADVADDYFFGGVSSVVEDSHGNIYVMDSNQPALMKFSSDGQLQHVLARVGEGPGDLPANATIAIDGRDRLFLVGQGGRVEILDPELAHVGSFERANAADMARAIAVHDDGTIVICVRGRQDETIIDQYGPDHVYQRSYGDNFVKGRNAPWYVGSTYIGGDLAVLAPDAVVCAQLAPYAVRKYDRSGRLLTETTAGGADFVPMPPMPEVDGDRIMYRMFPHMTGIAALVDGRVVVTSFTRSESERGETLICLHDGDLALLAVGEAVGFESIVGAARDGSAYFYRSDDEQKVVVRARLRRVRP